MAGSKMVMQDFEMVELGEVEYPFEVVEQESQDLFVSQASINDFMALDEFQNILSYEDGTDLGSMNMDEFLTCIYNADQENQTINNTSDPPAFIIHENNNNNNSGNTFMINENSNNDNNIIMDHENNSNTFIIDDNNINGNTYIINENNNNINGNTYIINENNNGINGNTFVINENNSNSGNTFIINENNNNSGNTIIVDENNSNNNGNSIAQMGMPSLGQAPAPDQGGIASQPSLEPQPSLPIPATLNNTPSVNVPNPNQSAALDQTLGEMTLEDFLVKAGICRKSVPAPQHQLRPLQPQLQPQYFGMYYNNNINIAQGFVGGTMMRMPGGIGTAAAAGVSAFLGMPQGGGAIRESSGYGGNGYRNAAVFSPHPQVVAYGGRFEQGQAIGIPASISPITPDGMYAVTPIHTLADQFGMGMHSLRGRRRNIEGSAERVEERKHRRMIKNRESAARSRARKQAYTLALEAELDKLREENSQLKQAMMEREKKRKQQLRVNEVKMKAFARDERAKEKRMVLKRTFSGSI